MLAGGDVAMAQRKKKPLWQLCLAQDWAAVQQRIRDKDVEDINENNGIVSFHAIHASWKCKIMKWIIQRRRVKQKNHGFCGRKAKGRGCGRIVVVARSFFIAQCPNLKQRIDSSVLCYCSQRKIEKNFFCSEHS